MSLRRRRSRAEKPKAAVDMTSLIDLTFLLLVTFIVTLTALYLKLHAYALKEANCRLVVELGKGNLEEVGIGAYRLAELLWRTGICEVTTTLTRDTDLASRLLHLLHQEYFFATSRSCCRSHQTRCARAYNYNVVHLCFKFSTNVQNCQQIITLLVAEKRVLCKFSYLCISKYSYCYGEKVDLSHSWGLFAGNRDIS